MSKLIVYKASAGSGKTWKLTFEYIKILFSEPSAYRNTLAVTFTNKATEEMKQRIIRELFAIASGSSEGMSAQLTRELNLSQAEIKEKAKESLQSILHDYSRFAVTTIDSFFQQILRSFARETGIPLLSAVEIESEKILSESVDQLFLRLQDYPELRDWFIRMSLERIEEGLHWDLKNDIQGLGKEILTERVQLGGWNTQKKQGLGRREYYSQLVNYRSELINSLQASSQEVLQRVTEEFLSVDDFLRKGTGIMNFFQKLEKKRIPGLGKTLKRALQNDNVWYSEKSEKKHKIQKLVDTFLVPALVRNVNELRTLNTVEIILKNYHVWGILDDLGEIMREYAVQRNIHLLSDTSKILHELIRGNDTPFLYERAGNTWNHFMIDEFQDTSRLQWENFLPLIKNGLASGFTSFIVGDVKQSIYRWRNGDWKILASELEKTFKDSCQVHNLQKNYRCCKEIIDFINDFFSICPTLLQEQLNEKLNDSLTEDAGFGYLRNIILNAYKEAQQEYSPATKEGGYLEFIFYPKPEETSELIEKEGVYLKQILKNLFNLGYSPGDIAILVRDKAYAKEMAGLLSQNNIAQETGKSFDLLTEEAIFLNNSPAVKVLICTLHYLLHPDDPINKALWLHEYSTYCIKRDAIPISNASSIQGDETYEKHLLSIEKEKDTLIKIPLRQLIQHLIHRLQLDEIPSQLPYLDGLKDVVIQTARIQILDIYSFLEWWKKNGDRQSLDVPGKSDSLRILTIHKSKGLEFPVVIIPHAYWSLTHQPFHNEILWCHSKDPVISLGGAVPVTFQKDLIDSHFDFDYFKEMAQYYVDQLNLLYVALTRAERELYLMAPFAGENDKTNYISSLILQTLAQTNPGFRLPENSAESFSLSRGIHPSRHQKENHESSPPLDFVRFKGIDLNGLKLREHAKDFFSIENSMSNKLIHKQEKNNQEVPSGLSNKQFPEENVFQNLQKGNLLHHVFERIYRISDLEKAIQILLRQGEINSDQAETLRNECQDYLKDPEVASWFSHDWTVRTESDILLPDGKILRPDRIMMRNEEVLLIDYKFGNEKKKEYHRQMKEYLLRLQEAGYLHSKGIIWYAALGEKEYIN